jgi:hypothetical protein
MGYHEVCRTCSVEVVVVRGDSNLETYGRKVDVDKA